MESSDVSSSFSSTGQLNYLDQAVTAGQHGVRSNINRNHGQFKKNVEDSSSYGAILELSDHEKRLLEDIMTLTDQQDQNRTTTMYGVPNTFHLATQQTHDKFVPTVYTQQARYGSHHNSVYPSATNNLSKYALEAIFCNLIYPDFCQGQAFTLDTLVQTTVNEPRGSFSESETNQRTFLQSKRTYRSTREASSRLTASRHPPEQRLAKRKRSCDTSQDNDNSKRMKHNKFSFDSESYHGDSSFHSSDSGRVIVHKRVRELMCHI